jgi:phosphotransferase system enzyme I (PtsI)
MAGDPLLTRLLLGMGLTNFSMHPAHLLNIKQRVLQSDVSAAKTVVDRIRRAYDPRKVSALLEKLNA